MTAHQISIAYGADITGAARADAHTITIRRTGNGPLRFKGRILAHVGVGDPVRGGAVLQIVDRDRGALVAAARYFGPGFSHLGLNCAADMDDIDAALDWFEAFDPGKEVWRRVAPHPAKAPPARVALLKVSLRLRIAATQSNHAAALSCLFEELSRARRASGVLAPPSEFAHRRAG